jgi:rare lipoprotein A (peptidoglycan hydrolase)
MSCPLPKDPFVGRSGRHRTDETPKILIAGLITAGLAVVALAAISAMAIWSDSSSAQMKSRNAVADPPRPLDRADRDQIRTPIATPTPEPSDVPSEQPTQAKKKRHRKILSTGNCEASYYGSGGRTASGETFDPDALTAAHKTLPLGSKVRVINQNNDRSVVVRINDRGPYVSGRCLDLSTAAMQAVGGMGSGVIPVKYEVLAKV